MNIPRPDSIPKPKICKFHSCSTTAYRFLTSILMLPHPRLNSSSFASPILPDALSHPWHLCFSLITRVTSSVVTSSYISVPWTTVISRVYMPNILPRLSQESLNSSFCFYTLLLNTEARVALLIYKFNSSLSKPSKGSLSPRWWSQSLPNGYESQCSLSLNLWPFPLLSLCSLALLASLLLLDIPRMALPQGLCNYYSLEYSSLR